MIAVLAALVMVLAGCPTEPTFRGARAFVAEAGSQIAAVSDVTLVAGAGTATVSWRDPEDAALSSIEITWTPGGATPQAVGPGVGTYEITGLAAGDTLSVDLVAVADDGTRSATVTESVSITQNAVPEPSAIYVTAEGLLYRFDDMTGAGLTTYDGSAGTPFTPSLNTVVEVNGTIYGVDGGSDILYSFTDMTGTGQTEYVMPGAPLSANPQGVAVSGGQVYVSDITAGVLYRFDDATGTNLITYDGSVGTFFTDPLRVRIHAGRIYVVDFDLALLYRFDDMAGTNQVEYDGGGASAFQNPRDVAFDSTGRIYVVDRINNVVQRIDDMSGAGAVEYGGTAGTAFTNPVGVWVDTLDRIYVVDSINGLLYRFDDMAGTNQMELDVTGTNGSVSSVMVVGP